MISAFEAEQHCGNAGPEELAHRCAEVISAFEAEQHCGGDVCGASITVIFGDLRLRGGAALRLRRKRAIDLVVGE